MANQIIKQIEPITNKAVNTFDSITSAVIVTGIPYEDISACLSGKTELAGGYRWRYV